MTAEQRRERVRGVEFWRFAFTVLVALYHLEIYFTQKRIPTGTTAVEFFFILAGFTMAMSASRRTEHVPEREFSAREAHRMAIDFVKNKLIAIFPLLALSLVLSLVVIPTVSPPMFTVPGAAGSASGLALLWERVLVLINSEWEWLFMVGTPMGVNLGADGMPQAPLVPLWFLTQLLAVGYLYTFIIYRKYDAMMFAAPLIAVLGYIYFTLHSVNILDFYLQMGPFNAGTVHAVSEMAMGMAIYQLYSHLSKRKWKLTGIICMQILELYAIARYCMLTFGSGITLGLDNFRRIPYVLIIVLLSFLNITFLSKLLNRKFMEKLGKISLTMYLIHFPLAGLYLSLLRKVKMWAFGNSLTGMGNLLTRVLSDSGGTDINFRPIPLSAADCVIYLSMVIIVSVAMNLLLQLIFKLFKAHFTANITQARAKYY